MRPHRRRGPAPVAWALVVGIMTLGSPVGLARGQGWRPPELKVNPPPPVKDAQKLLERALSYLGYPYSWGGVGSPAFDCSGFVCRVYAESGWALPRVSRDQAKVGRSVPLDSLQAGDLLFFAENGKPVSHVGIYMGDGNVVHASSGRGEVTVARLSAQWFRERLVSARRVLDLQPRELRRVRPTEFVEHTGASALLPMVRRPNRFVDPALGFRLASPEGTGVALRVMGSSEDETFGGILVPELTFIHRDWALELTAAVPIRIEPGEAPNVGAVNDLGDATRFVRTARLGLPGAELEVAFERLGSYRLVKSDLLNDLSPALQSTGVPGLSLGRSPLTLMGGFRPKGWAAEVVLDDVVRPGLLGAGVAWEPEVWIRTYGVASTDLRGALPLPEDANGEQSVLRRGVGAGALGLELAWNQGRRFAVGARAEGQLLHALSEVGVGTQATAFLRLGFGARRSTVLGLDLGGGIAGDSMVLNLFGPTYLASRPAHLEAVQGAEAARGTLGGQVLLRHGRYTARLRYGQGLGPRALAFDRELAAVIEVGGLSLGGPRILELRGAYAGRAPFDPNRGAHAVAASARLRLASWLSGDLMAQLGETFSAAGGLTVTWIP